MINLIVISVHEIYVEVLSVITFFFPQIALGVQLFAFSSRDWSPSALALYRYLHGWLTVSLGAKAWFYLCPRFLVNA